MAIYCYVKTKHNPHRKKLEYFSYTAMTVGLLLLFWSFYPIISFEIYSRLFIQNTIFSPVPSSQMASSTQAANSVLGAYDVFSTNLSSYTNAGVWFPTKPQIHNIQAPIKEYSLSIPKLNIKDAKVTVGGEDLAKSLVHYVPTSFPGEKGNVSIFGHSSLPQLYDSKNYKTIFTYLPSLQRGDQIIIKEKDETFTYEVYDMFVVNPDQVSILDQKYDDSYLTLVTCIPPGTWWKRLVVRSRLVKV
jgi:sortase A